MLVIKKNELAVRDKKKWGWGCKEKRKKERNVEGGGLHRKTNVLGGI